MQVNEIPAQKTGVTGAPYTTGPGLRKTDSEIVNMKKTPMTSVVIIKFLFDIKPPVAQWLEHPS